jgi:phosphoribosylformimino-5-aminoimidazole carboxamide ribotide isomerase
MTRFRPCIDLHSGQVKQIVGGTLTTASADLKTNYVSKLPACHFAKLYKDNDLTGAHVILLGPGNEEAAKEALAEWRGGLQVGGGITDANAAQWIEWGAEKVCKLPHGNGSYAFLFKEYPVVKFKNHCIAFALLM